MEEKIKNLIRELEGDIEKNKLESQIYSSKAVKLELIVLQLKEILKNREE